MLEIFLTPRSQMLRGREHEYAWVHQDGATAHTARISLALLHGFFLQRLISRYGDVSWHPCSPDLLHVTLFFGYT